MRLQRVEGETCYELIRTDSYTTSLFEESTQPAVMPAARRITKGTR